MTVTTIGALRDDLLGRLHGRTATLADLRRFFALMNLFIAAMLTMVLAGDSIVFFLGWEMMGLCSYFLIAYNTTSPQAITAGRKAFIMTRFADALLLAALLLLFLEAGSVRLDALIPAGVAMDEQPPRDHRLAAARRRARQVGAGAVPHLAALGHGRADAGVGTAAFGHHGGGGRVPADALRAASWRPEPVVQTVAAVLGVRHGGVRRPVGDVPAGREAAARLFVDQPDRLHDAVDRRRRARRPRWRISWCMRSSSRCCSSRRATSPMARRRAPTWSAMRGAWQRRPLAFAAFAAGAASLAGLPVVTAGWWSKEAMLAAVYGSGRWASRSGRWRWSSAVLTGTYAFRPVLIGLKPEPVPLPRHGAAAGMRITSLNSAASCLRCRWRCWQSALAGRGHSGRARSSAFWAARRPHAPAFTGCAGGTGAASSVLALAMALVFVPALAAGWPPCAQISRGSARPRAPPSGQARRRFVRIALSAEPGRTGRPPLPGGLRLALRASRPLAQRLSRRHRRSGRQPAGARAALRLATRPIDRRRSPHDWLDRMWMRLVAAAIAAAVGGGARGSRPGGRATMAWRWRRARPHCCCLHGERHDLDRAYPAAASSAALRPWSPDAWPQCRRAGCRSWRWRWRCWRWCRRSSSGSDGRWIAEHRLRLGAGAGRADHLRAWTGCRRRCWPCRSALASSRSSCRGTSRRTPPLLQRHAVLDGGGVERGLPVVRSAGLRLLLGTDAGAQLPADLASGAMATGRRRRSSS